MQPGRHTSAVVTRAKWQQLADTVEKGKNELIKIFACAPVKTGFS